MYNLLLFIKDTTNRRFAKEKCVETFRKQEIRENESYLLVNGDCFKKIKPKTLEEAKIIGSNILKSINAQRNAFRLPIFDTFFIVKK